jgi:hypothetical protein
MIDGIKSGTIETSTLLNTERPDSGSVTIYPENGDMTTMMIPPVPCFEDPNDPDGCEEEEDPNPCTNPNCTPPDPDPGITVDFWSSIYGSFDFVDGSSTTLASENIDYIGVSGELRRNSVVIDSGNDYHFNSNYANVNTSGTKPVSSEIYYWEQLGDHIFTVGSDTFTPSTSNFLNH